MSVFGAKAVRNTEVERFENAPAPARETIRPDLLLSIQSQSLTDDLEAAETPIKSDRTRSSATIYPYD